MKWYVGIHSGIAPMLGCYQAFRCAYEPSRETHGAAYLAIIGPFRTKRAALWAEKYGRANPHFRHVDDAEELARIAA